MSFVAPTPRDFIKATNPLKKWLLDIVDQLNVGYLVDVPEEPVTNIADAEAAINTTGKFAGKRVWDTTNKRELRAAGDGAMDEWAVVGGSAQVIPS